MRKLLKCTLFIGAALLLIFLVVYALNSIFLVRYDPEVFEGLKVGQSAVVIISQLQERYAPVLAYGTLYEYPLTNGQYIQIYVEGEDYIIQQISTSDTAYDFATIWFPMLSFFVK